jgi:hypothetical protein
MFLAALTDDKRRVHERILRDAVGMCGTLDQAAREADIDPKQFSRQLALMEGSHRRLAMQPDEFFQWLAVFYAAHFGLPRKVKEAYRLHRRSLAYRRMAKMTLPEMQQERRTA